MTCMTVWRSVLRVETTPIKISPHSFIFTFKKLWRRRALVARRIYFLETTFYPGRELGFEAFFAFYLAPFVASCFTGVGVPCIYSSSPQKIRHEVLFRFERPLLLMAGAVGAAVAGGDGASTGDISRGPMLDVWEVQNEGGSWIYFRWLLLDDFDKHWLT